MTIQHRFLTIDKLRSTIYDIKHNKFLGKKRQEAHQYSFVFQAANKCYKITTYISQKNISKRNVSFASFKRRILDYLRRKGDYLVYATYISSNKWTIQKIHLQKISETDKDRKIKLNQPMQTVYKYYSPSKEWKVKNSATNGRSIGSELSLTHIVVYPGL